MHPIGQHFIVGFEGTSVPKVLKKLIQTHNIGGVILFRRNISSKKQVQSLIKKIRSLSKNPLWISVDHEGGRVFRLPPPFTQIPSMQTIGDKYRATGDLDFIRELGQTMGAELREVGFNLNFSPVVDVHSNPANPVIGDRSFGPDPRMVWKCSEALIEGMKNRGIITCAKHFPGHGATNLDSHKTLPIVPGSGRLIWRRDITPFRKLIERKKIQTIMTAHVLYPELDSEHPATLSHPILTGLLRHKLGFDGVLFSDDLFMKALTDSPNRSAINFFKAGGDIALFCHHPEELLPILENFPQTLVKSPFLASQLQKAWKRIQRLKKRIN